MYCINSFEIWTKWGFSGGPAAFLQSKIVNKKTSTTTVLKVYLNAMTLSCLITLTSGKPSEHRRWIGKIGIICNISAFFKDADVCTDDILSTVLQPYSHPTALEEQSRGSLLPLCTRVLQVRYERCILQSLLQKAKESALLATRRSKCFQQGGRNVVKIKWATTSAFLPWNRNALKILYFENDPHLALPVRVTSQTFLPRNDICQTPIWLRHTTTSDVYDCPGS